VLCDFGGTINGYCSDITRCVFTGEIASDVADAYAVLFESQAAGVAAGVVGNACEDVDRASRAVIEKAGYGEYFVHRTGHGIGMEAHEDPYMVSGNKLPIAAGHAFSVEPGKFTYRLVRGEIELLELGQIFAHCRVDQGDWSIVPLTLLPPVA
jgi:Xaa-Pro aminopeptidase